MNCFSLAWRSVIRKPAKSALLFQIWMDKNELF